MLPQQHSKIDQLQSQNNESKSDLQSLNDLRQLLPTGNPIALMDKYSIRQSIDNHTSQHSWTSQNSEESRQMMLKIMQQNHQLIELKQQLYYYKTQFFRVADQNIKIRQLSRNQGEIKVIKKRYQDWKEQIQRKVKEIRCQNDELKKEIKRRQKEVKDLQKQLTILKTKKKQQPVKQIDHDLVEEVRRQTHLIMELTAKNQKILKINAFLKDQLSIAQNKLIRVELEQQEQTQGLLLQNMSRLKENKNIINHKHTASHHNWQTLPYQHRPSMNMYDSSSLHKQETVKLNSKRQSKEFTSSKGQSRTLEKDRVGLIASISSKMRPVQEPKPYRKAFISEISRKYGRCSQKFIA